MSAYSQAILGLGSNLGDRAEMLTAACEALANSDGTQLIAISPVYETEPVGLLEQPKFLNQVVAVSTMLDPLGLLHACLAIEQAHGRVRSVANAPRTLDVDLLFYEGVTLQSPELTLPHPRWRERAFVVAPLADLLASPAMVTASAWDDLCADVATLPDRSGVTQFC